MIKVFALPDLGEGLTESEIVSWKVSEGDSVKLNQVIAEVETAKAVVELPSPYDGVIAKLHESPGTVVEVGNPIVTFDLGGDDSSPEGSDGAAGDDPSEKRVPNLVGYGAEPEQKGKPARRARRGMNGAEQVQMEQVQTEQPRADRPRSTPPVRKLARDLNVDLSNLNGTGLEGLITRQDVQQAATTGAGASASASSERETRQPIKGVRKFTAQAMVNSAFTAPHVSEFLAVDVTATSQLLARLRTRKEFDGLKLTPLTIAARAVCAAIARNPSLNSRWDEQAQEIVTMHYVNLGIAAATPRGLVVPNIKDADSQGLAGLAAALKDLTETARAGKTSPEQMSGGTFSITNIGVFGIDAGTPILNPGESGILAMGAVRKQPWEYQGEIALRDVMTLSLSFDHRLVDGEQGSRFLADVGMILNDPAMLMAL